MVGIVISVVGVIIVLSVFPAFIKSLNTTLTTVIASNDTIGELFLGTVIPLLLCLTVAIAPSITPAYQTIKNKVKGKGKGKTSAQWLIKPRNITDANRRGFGKCHTAPLLAPGGYTWHSLLILATFGPYLAKPKSALKCR